MSDIKKVDDFLTEAKIFFVSTVKDGDTPKCRPFGLHVLHDDKIYFGAGTFKEVYKQLEENPKIEISATNGEDILRYYGKAVLTKNEEVLNIVAETLPEIMDAYKQMGGEMGLFYIDDATAEFRDMFNIKESYEFKY
ncbi:MAG: pyridoxamine 5'-phosphate oxidase family protein [Methanosphaera sp.]|nr:pyridoxamine 5'-phosphate oxidase family protein [Methanosphaera sp.]